MLVLVAAWLQLIILFYLTNELTGKILTNLHGLMLPFRETIISKLVISQTLPITMEISGIHSRNYFFVHIKLSTAALYSSIHLYADGILCGPSPKNFKRVLIKFCNLGLSKFFTVTDTFKHHQIKWYNYWANSWIYGKYLGIWLDRCLSFSHQ